MSRRKRAAPEAPTTSAAQKKSGINPQATSSEAKCQAAIATLREKARASIDYAHARLLLQWLEEPLGLVEVRGNYGHHLRLAISPDRLPNGLFLSLREAKRSGELLAGLGLAVFAQEQGRLYILSTKVDDRIKSGELAWSPKTECLTDARLVKMEAGGVWSSEAEARVAKAERENPSPGDRIGLDGFDHLKTAFIKNARQTDSEIEAENAKYGGPSKVGDPPRPLPEWRK